MNIKALIEAGNNVQFVVTALDLKEFADNIVTETLSQERASKPVEKYLSVKETAAMLHVVISTLWKWNKSGYLKNYRTGGKVWYKLSDVNKIMEGKA